MKNGLAALALALAAPTPAFAATSNWDIDPVHAYAGFSVRHMMVTNVKGEFGKVTGSLVLDESDITKSTVEATIDATTIDTREPKRDAHLKSPDFFDVEKHPTLTFKSTKVEKVKGAKDKLKVTGDLTIRGVTKPVVLDVEIPATETKLPKEMGGVVKRGARATTTINRQDFGVSWNSKLDSGGVVVGDEVSVTLEIELNKRVEAAATK